MLQFHDFNHKLNDKLEGLCYSTFRNQDKPILQKGLTTMKNISSAIFYMSEWQAIFQQEYSYSEARPFQDKQKNMIGLVS